MVATDYKHRAAHQKITEDSKEASATPNSQVRPTEGSPGDSIEYAEIIHDNACGALTGTELRDYLIQLQTSNARHMAAGSPMKRTLLSRPASRMPTQAQRDAGRSVLRTTSQGAGEERSTQLLLSEKLVSSEMSRSKQVTILGQSKRKYGTPESNCELALTGVGVDKENLLLPEQSDMRIETESTRFAYEAPTDRHNLIEKYINCVAFAAWLPCHCVMMGLPYF